MGHKTHTVIGNVQSVRTVGMSYYGNPIKLVTLTSGESYKTSVSAGVSYSAGNFEPHSLRMPVSPVVLTLTDYDRIVDMRRPTTIESAGFEITESTHGKACMECFDAAERAVTDARVTGSIGATYSEDNRARGTFHAATVRRVNR